MQGFYGKPNFKISPPNNIIKKNKNDDFIGDLY